MKYNTLYSRDSTGNIRIWYMEQDGDKYRTISGIDNGGLVTSEWTTALPKNEGKKNATTGEEQATKEIESKYKKQLKTGYFESIQDIDKTLYFEPMLAKNFEDYQNKIDWTKGVVVQIKYNGSRVIATRNGLFSRKGERYLSIPHIEEALRPFFNKFPEAVLDGEAFNYSLREQLNEIMKLVRKTVNVTKQDLQESKEKIQFFIYDGAVNQNYLHLSYNKRYEALSELLCKDNSIVLVPSWTVYSKEELDKIYNGFLEDNHEGAIVRLLNKPYEQKRSAALLKYKPTQDAEGIILDVLEGTGNWSGVAKTATLKWRDKEFDAAFKGSQEECKKILKEKTKWVGKEVTFLYNGLTGKLIPNFARIDINNCNKS